MINLSNFGAVCHTVPVPYNNFTHFCEAQHYVFYHNELIYSSLLLIFAVVLIWISWYGMENIEKASLVSKVDSDSLFVGFTTINKVSMYLIIAYLAWFHIFAYQAEFPEVANTFKFVIAIYVVWLFIKAGIKFYEYKKSK